MSVRGMATAVAGSAAAPVIVATSLGTTGAAAGPENTRDAHARVTPAVQPALAHPMTAQPAWLRRLLSRSDPPMEAPHHKS